MLGLYDTRAGRNESKDNIEIAKDTTSKIKLNTTQHADHLPRISHENMRSGIFLPIYLLNQQPSETPESIAKTQIESHQSKLIQHYQASIRNLNPFDPGQICLPTIGTIAFGFVAANQLTENQLFAYLAILTPLTTFLVEPRVQKKTQALLEPLLNDLNTILNNNIDKFTLDDTESIQLKPYPELNKEMQAKFWDGWRRKMCTILAMAFTLKMNPIIQTACLVTGTFGASFFTIKEELGKAGQYMSTIFQPTQQEAPLPNQGFLKFLFTAETCALTTMLFIGPIIAATKSLEAGATISGFGSGSFFGLLPIFGFTIKHATQARAKQQLGIRKDQSNNNTQNIDQPSLLAKLKSFPGFQVALACSRLSAGPNGAVNRTLKTIALLFIAQKQHKDSLLNVVLTYAGLYTLCVVLNDYWISREGYRRDKSMNQKIDGTDITGLPQFEILPMKVPANEAKEKV